MCDVIFLYLFAEYVEWILHLFASATAFMVDGKDNENKKWALKSELLEQRNRPSESHIGRSVARKI